MRIKNLEISGFRGFSRSASFDLDAEAIIVIGANGQGKTSLFDAILWAITGQVPRLGTDDEHLISMFSENGEARVLLSLRGTNGDELLINRRFDGEQQYLQLDHAGETTRGTAATTRILEALWPASVAVQDPSTALSRAFTRSVYLQQDLVREFVEADDEQQRFSVVSELCGAGQVVEFQHQLEKSRTAWSRAASAMESEVNDLSEQLAAVESQLARMHEGLGVDDELRAQWNHWWRRVGDLGALGGSTPPYPEIGDTNDGLRLATAVRGLTGQRQAAERALDSTRRLRQEVSDRSSMQRFNVDALRNELTSKQAEANALRGRLVEAQGRAAEVRRRQVQEREEHEEVAALAELALRHLGERCPVCDQEYDHETARRHLESHLARTGSSAPEAGEDEVARLAGLIEQQERSVAQSQAQLRRAEISEREISLWEADRNRRLADLDLEPGVPESLLATLAERIDRQVERSAVLRSLEHEGESLALRLARESEAARRNEVQRQANQLADRVREKKQESGLRQGTGEVASQIIEQLREASLEVVSAQVEQIGPLLQRIYATTDPHPAFRSISLLTKIFRGKGRLSATIHDAVQSKSSPAPELVLSSSQINAFAVSMFLALNLGVHAIPISTIMLDDPLQSLDDVNLLGLIDLLRRSTSKRQLVVSTHDQRFGRLLERKLRPISGTQRTRVIQLEGWGRSGPHVRQDDVERDPKVLRMVAA